MPTMKDWPKTRLKYAVDCNVSVLTNRTDEQFEFEYVDVGDVSQGKIDITGTKMTFADAPSRARRLAEPGDTVLSTVRTYLRAVAQVPETSTNLVFSTGLAVLHPRKSFEPRWLAYFLQSEDFIDEVVSRSVGVSYPAISPHTLVSLPIPKPLLVEQRFIADYLDHETARIDTLIEKQEEFIDILQERRTAAIQRFVSQGLDPKAHMVDSGVNWLGNVPSAWGISRLKNSIASVQTGTWGEEPDGAGADIACVRVADFDRPRRCVREEVPTLRSVPAKDQQPRLLVKGDLLLERSGGTDSNPVGFVVMYEGDAEAVTSNFISRLRLQPGHVPKYWLYAHAAAYETNLTARSVKKTTGIQNLDLSSYFNELFPYPPISEQRAIARYLDDLTSNLDRLIQQSQQFIDLTKERRAALITAVVTGQIDVREETPRG